MAFPTLTRGQIVDFYPTGFDLLAKYTPPLTAIITRINTDAETANLTVFLPDVPPVVRKEIKYNGNQAANNIFFALLDEAPIPPDEL